MYLCSFRETLSEVFTTRKNFFNRQLLEETDLALVVNRFLS